MCVQWQLTIHDNNAIIIIIIIILVIFRLGLVSPGAVTDGCHHIFSKNMTTFFLVITCESDDLFYPSFLQHSHLPMSFIQYAFKIQPQKINFRSGVTPVECATRGGPPHPPHQPYSLVTPLRCCLHSVETRVSCSYVRNPVSSWSVLS